MATSSASVGRPFADLLVEVVNARAAGDDNKVRSILAGVSDLSLRERLQAALGETESAPLNDTWIESVDSLIHRVLGKKWGLRTGVLALVGTVIYGGSFLPGPRALEPQQQFPALVADQYRLGLYQEINVVPAPDIPIVVDGDLREWNRSGQFHTELDVRLPGQRYLEGMMMFGNDNLYIGAHIGDPFPMKSAVKGDPGLEGWRGGGLQVRLALPNTTQPPNPNDDHIVHLDLWFDQERACLHLARGMDFHGGQWLNAIPGAFEGAFRRDPDGRGYVLEYRIPWKSLHNNVSCPSTGEKLPMCWNVIWADADGKEWQFKLVECYNPARVPNEGSGPDKTFTEMATWGRARFQVR